MKKALLWGAFLIMAALLYRTPYMVESSIPSIYYITPNQKTYETVVNCTGTIYPVSVQEIYLDSAAVPSNVLVETGDYVEKGDVLATLDANKTAQLSAQPLQALQQLIAADIAPSPTVSSDIAALLSAYGIDANALQGLDSFPENANVSAAWVNSASARDIVAPISGVITQMDITPYAPVTAGKVIITITQTDAYKALATIGEGEIGKIKVGDTAKLRGVAFGGSVYSGTVCKIYPVARKSLSGTNTETVVDVEITIDNPDNKLKPGFTTKAEIQGEENYRLITVPYEAIRQDENNDEYVYVYTNGKLQKKSITTGKELTSEVEILSGLDADSIVVYNPSDIIKEGTMINIKGRADVH